MLNAEYIYIDASTTGRPAYRYTYVALKFSSHTLAFLLWQIFFSRSLVDFIK